MLAQLVFSPAHAHSWNFRSSDCHRSVKGQKYEDVLNLAVKMKLISTTTVTEGRLYRHSLDDSRLPGGQDSSVEVASLDFVDSPLWIGQSHLAHLFSRGRHFLSVGGRVVGFRHYQPKTATFETRSIPPAFVRRISRPTAKRNTAGSCRADGIRAHKVLVTGRLLRVRRGAWPATSESRSR